MEGVPAIDFAGDVIAFHGTGNKGDYSQHQASTIRINLLAQCQDQLRTLVLPQDPVGLAVGYKVPEENRPSISFDGSRIAVAIPSLQGPTNGTNKWKLVVLPRLTSVVQPDIEVDYWDGRSLRPQLSGDGRTIWTLQRPGASGTGPAGSQIVELAADLMAPAVTCFGATQLGDDMLSIVPGVSQPAITPTGDALVGVLNTGSATELRRVRRPASGSWCTHDTMSDMPVQRSIAKFKPVDFVSELGYFADPQACPSRDATIRSDGGLIAWTTYSDHCDPGVLDPAQPFMEHSELWLWYENALEMPPWMAPFTCTAVGTGETLVRFPMDAVNSSDEMNASLSADGRVLTFVSTGNPDFVNPFGRTVACAVSLDPAVAPAVRQVSQPFMNEYSPEHVVAQAVSGSGAITVYAISRDTLDWQDTDHRLVNLFAPGAAAGPDPNFARPPRDPVDIELLSCSIQGSAVVADVNVRRFRSNPVPFVIGGSATSGSTTVAFTPLVQSLDVLSSATVVLRTPVPLGFVSPTCDVRVIDCTTSDCGMNLAGMTP